MYAQGKHDRECINLVLLYHTPNSISFSLVGIRCRKLVTKYLRGHYSFRNSSFAGTSSLISPHLSHFDLLQICRQIGQRKADRPRVLHQHSAGARVLTDQTKN
ncbi:unnamed protein product [Ixodes pacificus]